jgi:hypothetical protein
MSSPVLLSDTRELSAARLGAARLGMAWLGEARRGVVTVFAARKSKPCRASVMETISLFSTFLNQKPLTFSK